VQAVLGFVLSFVVYHKTTSQPTCVTSCATKPCATKPSEIVD
jgi:hypothetical protein